MSPKAWAKSLFQARPQSTATRPAPARPRLGVEALETRLVPAVDVSMLTGNAVHITADNPASDGGVDVYVETVGRRTTVWEGARRWDFADAASVQFFGGRGNDSFKGFATHLPVTAHGAGGNDVLRGGAGNDVLRGGSGDDTLYGRGGNDRYEYVAGLQQGHDTLFAGYENRGGVDTLDFQALSGVNVDLASTGRQQVNPLAAVTLARLSEWEPAQPMTVFGTNAADTISGSGAADRLWGNGGNDTLAGNGGDDLLSGGMGNDSLSGGTGNDTYRFDRGTFNPGHLGTDTLAYDTGDTDTFDFSALGAGVTADLATGAVQSAWVNVAYATPGAAGRVENAVGTPFNDTFFGSKEANVLDGGAGGADWFYGSPGADVYLGRGGADTLSRGGYHGYFADGSAEDTTFDKVRGEAAGRLSWAELQAKGQLNFFRDQAGDRVWLTGPSGAGFALKSQWQTASVGSAVEFRTTSPVTLETAWGDVPLPAVGVAFSVRGAGTTFQDVGQAPDFLLGGVPLTSSGLTGLMFGGLGADLTANFEAATGADLALPGVSWGAGLGTTVAGMDDDAPVNPAVPYLFANAPTGLALKYDAIEAEAPGNLAATVLFAPGDGTIYAGLSGVPVVSDVGVGVSPEGYLPYAPDAATDLAAAPEVLGHLYLRGAVDVKSLTLTGEVVVDLDKNDDGRLLNGLVNNFRDATSAGLDRAFQGVKGLANNVANPAAVLGDVAFGVNVGAKLGMKGFSVDLSGASVYTAGDGVAFKAGTNATPFAGVPGLEHLSVAGGSAEGWFGAGDQWRMRFSFQTAGVAGYTLGSLVVTAGSGNVKARATAAVAGGGVMSFTLWANDDWEMRVGHLVFGERGGEGYGDLRL